MKKYLSIYLFFVSMAISAGLQAQQPGVSMSLQDCLQYAANNQVKIKNAILDQLSSDARNKEVTGMALPQLTGKGSLNHAPLVAAFVLPNFIKTIVAGDPASGQSGLVDNSALNQQVVNSMPNTMQMAFQPKWTTTGTVEASQLVFDPSVMVALQARKALEELAARNVAITVQDIKVSVTKSYYNVLVAEKQKALIDQNIVRMRQMEFETKEIHKNGFAEKIDVDRIQVVLNNLETQQVRIDQMIRLAYLSLKFQMGMPLRHQLVLADSLSDQQIDNDILNAQFDISDRQEFRIMETQNRLYAYDAKRYRLGWLPTFSLFGNFGYTLYNFDRFFYRGDDWQRSAMIGANLSIPLFDGFQRRQKLKQADFALMKGLNDMENLKMALEFENENARISLNNNLLALGNQRRNMQLAEEIYHTARIKYKEGVGSSLEVMDAESSLKEAQTNYFTALYEVIAARVDLQKSLGQIQ